MSSATGPMACPVDQTPLVMSDRQGIEIDYCPTCRGVWLDRGELDKIIDRSAAPGGGAASVPPPQQQPQPQPQPQPGYNAPPPQQGGHWQPQGRPGPAHYGDEYHQGHGYKRRKSWLSDIFD